MTELRSWYSFFIIDIDFCETDNLDNTERGDSGFGSTGK